MNIFSSSSISSMAPRKRRSTSIKNIMPKKQKTGGMVIPPAVAPAAPTPPPPGVPPPPGMPPQPPVTGGAPATGILGWFNSHLQYLNTSKYFAGLCMIMLNVGSKYVTIKFSKSAEEYFKANVTKQILVFSMGWMVTRDILTALIITAIFVVLSDHLFNEESNFCIVPKKYRVLSTLVDTNGDGVISNEEIEKAEETLRKAKQQKMRQDQRSAFLRFEQDQY